MSRDMADMLLKDIENAVTELNKLKHPTLSREAHNRQEKQHGKVYTH
jgi:glutamate decarboxylase